MLRQVVKLTAQADLEKCGLRKTGQEIAAPNQDHIGYWVGTLSSAIRKGAEDELAQFGVTPAQWAILEAAFLGNANTLTSLAKIIPVDAAAISRQLDKLQQMGLVRRRIQRDRQEAKTYTDLALTPPGDEEFTGLALFAQTRGGDQAVDKRLREVAARELSKSAAE